MISVIIPTFNAARQLQPAFQSLFDAAIDGLVGEVIVSDCGSTDGTRVIADAAGATVIETGLGQQLLGGALAARKPWLLFLAPGAVPLPGWEIEIEAFIAKGDGAAAAFRSQRDYAFSAGLREALAAYRRPFSACPALLVKAELFNSLGGLTSMPPRDLGDLTRSLGRSRISRLQAKAVYVH